MSKHKRTDARTHIVDGRDIAVACIALLVIAIHLVVYMQFTQSILR